MNALITSGEEFFKYIHKCLTDIDKADSSHTFLEQIHDMLGAYQATDPHPQSSLGEMVETAIDLIQTRYHGCNDSSAQNYLDFLKSVQALLHTMAPKVVLFMKHLVNEIKRHLLN